MTTPLVADFPEFGRPPSWRDIDRVGRPFEFDSRNGCEPKIEILLPSGDENSELRTRLQAELLAVELERRAEAGESPAVGEYVNRFPKDRAPAPICRTSSHGQNAPCFRAHDLGFRLPPFSTGRQSANRVAVGNKITKTNFVGQTMILVPPGEFLMRATTNDE